jgi:hypothetical protein
VGAVRDCGTFLSFDLRGVIVLFFWRFDSPLAAYAERAEQNRRQGAMNSPVVAVVCLVRPCQALVPSWTPALWRAAARSGTRGVVGGGGGWWGVVGGGGGWWRVVGGGGGWWGWWGGGGPVNLHGRCLPGFTLGVWCVR